MSKSKHEFFSQNHSQIDYEPLLNSILSQTPPPYQLTVPLDDLLTSRQKSDGTIPRPKNSFMLFRIDYNARIKAQASLPPNMTVCETSVIASQAWRQQPPHVLQFFEILSMVAVQRHKAMYPTYKQTLQKKKKKREFWPTPLTSSTPPTPPTPPTPLTRPTLSPSPTPPTPTIPLTPPTLTPSEDTPLSNIGTLAAVYENVTASSIEDTTWIRHVYTKKILGF